MVDGPSRHEPDLTRKLECKVTDPPAEAGGFSVPRVSGQSTGRGYGRPGLNIPGRIEVGGVFMAARNTGEGGLVRSVLLVDAAALRALARGVAWIDEHDWNAAPPRLVGGEGAKLAEAPVGQTGSTGAAGRYPAADAFEFFKG